MKIKLLVKKIKYKIIKFLYEYFKKIYIRNINIADNKILQYAHNELIIAGYNKNCTYYIDIIEIISIINEHAKRNSSISYELFVINKLYDKTPITPFSKKPVGTYRFDTKAWEKNDKGITWHGGLFEHKDNVLTGRYFGICNIWYHEIDKGYMPKSKRVIPCVEVEIAPDDWIMAVSADSTELLLLSCDYNIKWE